MDRKSLVMDVAVGDSVSVDDGRLILTVKEKSGQRTKLHFNSESNVSITPVRARTAADQAKRGLAAV